MFRREHLFLSVRLLLHALFLLLFIWPSLPPRVSGQTSGGYSLATELILQRFSNVTPIIKEELKDQLTYCVLNIDEDWNGAFNFSKDPSFITNCAKKMKGGSMGEIMQRLCSVKELKMYGESLMEFKKGSHLKPNKNCNLSTWNPGCEPGWACGTSEKVDVKNKTYAPFRTDDCSPCCEGFFCPQGLTCMIPCPKGAYCPLGKANTNTGRCEPYSYQLPPGKRNHTCGGADRWADVMSSKEVFCSGGSYCPSSIQKNPCSSGHYCRLGSTSQEGCFGMASCKANSENQNITAHGIMLFAAIILILVVIYNCTDQVLSVRERRQARSREKAVQSVRETAQAREKWKSAKDFAKMGAAEITRTLSRITSTRDQPKGTGQAKPGSDGAMPRMPPTGAGTSEAGTSKGKQAPKGKQLHTQSQIFKFAYGQIEKEKALQEQNENSTFSGVSEMTSTDIDIDIRKRPPIEVAFKDLTLTLKGKNIHLMRCVTGKLSPGRVSAVMGPSGAGKNNFSFCFDGKSERVHHEWYGTDKWKDGTNPVI